MMLSMHRLFARSVCLPRCSQSDIPKELSLREGAEVGGRGREASSGRTYESLRIAARIVLHYYMRGEGDEAEKVLRRGGRGRTGYVRSIKPPRNYPLCIA